MCIRLLWIFYQWVVSSIIFFAVMCWGGGIRTRGANKLGRLVSKASSVVGTGQCGGSDIEQLERDAES